jgi:hypothetical protein
MDNDFNRRTNLDRRDGGMSGMMVAGLAALAIIFGLLLWAPWNGPRTADNATPGTTVGSSTTRPATPAAPSPAPAAPAAPSTTR